MTLLRLLSTFFLLLLWTTPSVAERHALVIGNDRYAALPTLQKAASDARAVARSLQAIGFSVIAGENLTRSEMQERLFELGDRIQPGDTVFFFYAGHGLELGGGNLLLPVDVPDPEGRQAEDRIRESAIAEADIVARIQRAGAKLTVVVLDACRDNPFRSLTRSAAARDGLSRPPESRGLFTLYSAGFGQTALDRLSDNDPDPNSVFTRVLAPALTRPGLSLVDLAYEVGDEVERLARTVGHEQSPAYYDQARARNLALLGEVSGAQIPRSQLQQAVPPAATESRSSDQPSTPAPAIGNSCEKVQPDMAAAVAAGDKAAFRNVIRTYADCTEFAKAQQNLLGFLVSVELPRTKAGDADRISSGVLIDSGGLILASRMAIDTVPPEQRDSLVVRMSDNSSFPVEIDARLDDPHVAMLSIPPGIPVPNGLRAVRLSDSPPKAEERMIVLDHQSGSAAMIDLAIVARMNETDAASGTPFFRIDLGFDSANAGGPVLNQRGDLAGIRVDPGAAGDASAGGTYVVPISWLSQRLFPPAPAVGQAWLGVEIQVVTEEIAASLGLDRPRGALVSRLVPGGPAEQAGILANDVILSVNGTPVEVAQDLPRLISTLAGGATTRMEIFRKSQGMFVSFNLGVRDATQPSSSGSSSPAAQASIQPLYGMVFGELTDDVRARIQLAPGTRGLLVAQVQAGSEAERSGLKAGEVLLEVGSQPVNTREDANSQLARLRQEGRKALLLVAGEGGNQRFVVIGAGG